MKNTEEDVKQMEKNTVKVKLNPKVTIKKHGAG